MLNFSRAPAAVAIEFCFETCVMTYKALEWLENGWCRCCWHRWWPQHFQNFHSSSMHLQSKECRILLRIPESTFEVHSCKNLGISQKEHILVLKSLTLALQMVTSLPACLSHMHSFISQEMSGSH